MDLVTVRIPEVPPEVPVPGDAGDVEAQRMQSWESGYCMKQGALVDGPSSIKMSMPREFFTYCGCPTPVQAVLEVHGDGKLFKFGA